MYCEVYGYPLHATELFYPEECHVMAQKAEQIRNCREIKPAFSMMHVKACAWYCQKIAF